MIEMTYSHSCKRRNSTSKLFHLTFETKWHYFVTIGMVCWTLAANVNCLMFPIRTLVTSKRIFFS